MQELNGAEIEAVGGAITAVEGAGLIIGLAAFAASSPVVIGVALGAAGGLLIADFLAK